MAPLRDGVVGVVAIWKLAVRFEPLVQYKEARMYAVRGSSS